MTRRSLESRMIPIFLMNPASRPRRLLTILRGPLVSRTSSPRLLKELGSFKDERVRSPPGRGIFHDIGIKKVYKDQWPDT